MATNNKSNRGQSVVESDVSTLILNGVLTVVKSTKKSSWVGTMTDLNSALVKVLGRSSSKLLPKSPSALRVALNKTLTRLRNRSVSVKFSRSSDHARTRYVEFVTR